METTPRLRGKSWMEHAERKRLLKKYVIFFIYLFFNPFLTLSRRRVAFNSNFIAAGKTRPVDASRRGRRIITTSLYTFVYVYRYIIIIIIIITY